MPDFALPVAFHLTDLSTWNACQHAERADLQGNSERSACTRLDPVAVAGSLLATGALP